MNRPVTIIPSMRGGFHAHCPDCGVCSRLLPEGAARAAAREHQQQHDKGDNPMKMETPQITIDPDAEIRISKPSTNLGTIYVNSTQLAAYQGSWRADIEAHLALIDRLRRELLNALVDDSDDRPQLLKELEAFR